MYVKFVYFAPVLNVLLLSFWSMLWHQIDVKKIIPIYFANRIPMNVNDELCGHCHSLTIFPLLREVFFPHLHCSATAWCDTYKSGHWILNNNFFFFYLLVDRIALRAPLNQFNRSRKYVRLLKCFKKKMFSDWCCRRRFRHRFIEQLMCEVFVGLLDFFPI